MPSTWCRYGFQYTGAVLIAVAALPVEDCTARSFENTSATLGDDYVALASGRDDNSGTIRRLIGAYQGTIFSVPLEREKMAGMANYPEAVEYGQSSRYVWISSYYRYFSGITLLDLLTQRRYLRRTGGGRSYRRIASGWLMELMVYMVCSTRYV